MPTTIIATTKVLGPRQLPPTPLQPARQAKNAERSDAMAEQVEKHVEIFTNRGRKKRNSTRMSSYKKR